MPEAEKKPGLFTLPWFKPFYRRAILIALIAIWCGWGVDFLPATSSGA